MKNKEVAELLYKIADLLDIKGDIFFKTRAYRIAAQVIESLEEDIEKIAKEDRLKEIEGVGDALAKKITEYLERGSLEYYEKLKKEVPEELLSFLQIPTLGPKKIAALYKNLNITKIEDLKKACIDGKLRDLDGFGLITEKNILRGLQLMEKASGRFLLNIAYDNGIKYVEYLKLNDKIEKVSIAGSLRRMKETIGDIDILASSKYPDDIMEYFVGYSDVQRVLLKGSTKTSVLLNDNIQVDLRVVEPVSFGSALQYFTGSKEHNVKIRGIAIKNGYKLNEYGLFNKETDEFVIGRDEKEIYEKLKMHYIEPELRENRGEIEASLNNSLPELVKISDINGDFHVHSLWSDGSDEIRDIAVYSKNIGYKFICIADHSQSLKIAKGLSEEKLLKKRDEIKKINKELSDFKILFGTECDIKSDGSLDYSNKILSMFDFVGAAIHTGFKMSVSEATDRIVRAMDNDYVHFLAHPTGRIIGRRDEFDLNFEKILDTVKDKGKFLEINSFPDRLDLNDVYSKQAKEKGIKLTISTDAHSIKHLAYMKFGVATARRGWLEKKDIVNTYTIGELEKLLGGFKC